MQWNRLLLVYTDEFADFVKRLIRDNHLTVRAFLLRRRALFNLFAAIFIASHMFGLVVGGLLAFDQFPYVAQLVDFLVILVSNVSLLGALYELAVLLIIAATAADLAEGVPNLASGLFRRIAQARGIAVPVAGDEDIGFDKVKAGAKIMQVYGSGLITLHAVWCLVIWTGYVFGHPAGFQYRVGMMLAFFAAVVWTGYKDMPMSTAMKNGIHAGIVAWFILLTLGSMDFFQWLGLEVPDGIVWSDDSKMVPWYIIGAVILSVIAGALRSSAATRGAARLAALGVVILVIMAIWPWYSSKKDTPLEDVLPKDIARPIVAVGKGINNRAEKFVGTASADTNPEVSVVPAEPVEFPFEVKSCDPKDGILYVGLMGASYTPLVDAEELKAHDVNELHDLVVSEPRSLLWVKLLASTRYTWQVNPVTHKFRRDPSKTTRKDPFRKWTDLEFTGTAWQLQVGATCHD